MQTEMCEKASIRAGIGRITNLPTPVAVTTHVHSDIGLVWNPEVYVAPVVFLFTDVVSILWEGRPSAHIIAIECGSYPGATLNAGMKALA